MTEPASGLAVSDLEIRFGGHVAVDRVTFTAPRGRITGLIGPNGAGKTTTFNACSGLLRPSHGTVTLDGTELTDATVATRARAGMGRTFQRMELFDSLAVRHNIAVGRVARLAGRNPLRQILEGRSERRDVARRVEEAAERCGVAQLLDLPAGPLSTGQRRLVELARTVAGGFDMLLLDEPSSGLDPAETEEFGKVLGDLIGDGVTGILLVEHDMALVMSVCAQLHILDFGRLIFSGAPQMAKDSPVVQEVYMGSRGP